MLSLPFWAVWIISIHALLAESDSVVSSAGTTGKSFLSTLSLRRATAPSHSLYLRNKNFYPRSPCGERPSIPNPGKVKVVISIHALLAESDKQLVDKRSKLSRFLSTLSLRRATSSFLFLWCRLRHFYPRSPCGERPSGFGWL